MRREPKYIILLFSIILGIIISFQFKGKIDMYVPVTLNSLQDTKKEIDMIKKEMEELDKLEKSKKQELDKLEKLLDSDEDILESMESDILKNKILAGVTTLKGPGIIISLYDNDEERGIDYEYDINDDIIHDIDILNIINDLKIAGAEAISVNNQRVLSNSEVFCGGPTIIINERSSSPPFIIKAIGDPTLLNASVTAPGTYGDSLKNGMGKGLETSMEDIVTVEGYKKISNFRYARPKTKEG